MERERECSGECSSIPNARLAEYGGDREGTDARVLTDGGQAQLDEPDDDSEEVDEDAESPEAEAEDGPADQEAESDEAKAEAEEAEETEEGKAEAEEAAEGDEGEAEAEEAAEGDEGEAEAEERAEGDEGEAEGGTQDEDEEAEQAHEAEDTEDVETDEEDETEAGEEEAAEEAGEAGEEDGEETAEEPGHDVEDADQVYQSGETAGVAHLDLEGLFLDVLGLEVNLNEVTLDVSARPGGNNLLGNLLSAVTGLLDGGSSMLEKVKALLSKPAEWVSGMLERPRELLGTLVRSPGQFLTGLFGFEPEAVDVGPLGDEQADEAEAEGEPADEEADAEEGDEEASRGRISAAVAWLKEKLVSLVPGLPVEDLLATILRETLQTLVDTLEESVTDAGDEQQQEGEPAEAPA